MRERKENQQLQVVNDVVYITKLDEEKSVLRKMTSNLHSFYYYILLYKEHNKCAFIVVRDAAMSSFS